MFAQKTKTAEKIFVEAGGMAAEAKCLPAVVGKAQELAIGTDTLCADAGVQVASSQGMLIVDGNNGNFFKSGFRLICALGLSTCMAMLGIFSVQLGYDWGYKLVEQFLGQENEIDQGIAAITSNCFINGPLFFGLSFACFREAVQSWKYWSVVGISGVFAGFCAYSLLMKSDLSWMTRLEFLPLFLVGLFVYFAAFWLGRLLSKNLRYRVRLTMLLAVSFLGALGLSSACSFLADRFWGFETLVNAAVLSIISLTSVFAGRARDKTTAVLFSISVALPFLLASTINVASSTLSLAFNWFSWGQELGWRAPLSAWIILAISVFSVVSGGLLGLKLRKAWISPE